MTGEIKEVKAVKRSGSGYKRLSFMATVEISLKQDLSVFVQHDDGITIFLKIYHCEIILCGC